jgi:hypothetical protein
LPAKPTRVSPAKLGQVVADACPILANSSVGLAARRRHTQLTHSLPQVIADDLGEDERVIHRSAAIGRHSTVGSYGGADMRLIPSMLKASDADLAAVRAQLRSRLMVPPDTPPEEVDLALEEIADKIIAYLSSPVPSAPDPPYRVGPCKSCGAEDCYATAEPWAAPLTLIDGKGYITGGFCCAHHIGWPAIGDCAHPMIEK